MRRNNCAKSSGRCTAAHFALIGHATDNDERQRIRNDGQGPLRTRGAGITARNRAAARSPLISRSSDARRTMANEIAYAKTATGKAEVAAQPGKLPTGLKTLLGMIENSTVAQLLGKLPQVQPDKLNAALDRLFVDGYIEIVPAAAAAPATPEAGLDFAQFITPPVKEPTIQQMQRAEETLSCI